MRRQWIGCNSQASSISRGFVFNFSAIRTITMNIEASKTSSSYCYLSRLDFTKAFGANATLLVAKDFQSIRVQIPKNPPKNVQFYSLEPGLVEILGDVVRPVQLLLVNSDAKQSFDSNQLFCLDDMASDEESSQEKVKEPHSEKPRFKPKSIGGFLNTTLFRRRMKCKSFLELTETEREAMASVLKYDKFKDKSRFHYILHNKLVQPSDYVDPDFKPVDLPVDVDYQFNYSLEAPSVHDLFDLATDSGDIAYEDYEEYLDEDMEM